MFSPPTPHSGGLQGRGRALTLREQASVGSLVDQAARATLNIGMMRTEGGKQPRDGPSEDGSKRSDAEVFKESQKKRKELTLAQEKAQEAERDAQIEKLKAYNEKKRLAQLDRVSKIMAMPVEQRHLQLTKKEIYDALNAQKFRVDKIKIYARITKSQERTVIEDGEEVVQKVKSNVKPPLQDDKQTVKEWNDGEHELCMSWRQFRTSGLHIPMVKGFDKPSSLKTPLITDLDNQRQVGDWEMERTQRMFFSVPDSEAVSANEDPRQKRFGPDGKLLTAEEQRQAVLEAYEKNEKVGQQPYSYGPAPDSATKDQLRRHLYRFGYNINVSDSQALTVDGYPLDYKSVLLRGLGVEPSGLSEGDKDAKINEEKSKKSDTVFRAATKTAQETVAARERYFANKDSTPTRDDGNVIFSLSAMESQDRMQGRPMLGKGHFLQKCAFTLKSEDYIAEGLSYAGRPKGNYLTENFAVFHLKTAVDKKFTNDQLTDACAEALKVNPDNVSVTNTSPTTITVSVLEQIDRPADDLIAAVDDTFIGKLLRKMEVLFEFDEEKYSGAKLETLSRIADASAETPEQKSYGNTAEFLVELGRKWYQLFRDQEYEVQQMSLLLANVYDQGLKKEERKEKTTENVEDVMAVDQGDGKTVLARSDERIQTEEEYVLSKQFEREKERSDDLKRTFKDEYVLAITERGNMGILKSGGEIYPLEKLQTIKSEDDEVDFEKEEKGESFQLDDSEEAKGDAMNYKVTDDFCKDFGEYEFYQAQNWTWPLTKIARTPEWFEWAHRIEPFEVPVDDKDPDGPKEEKEYAIKGIPFKNRLHFTILEQMFGSDGSLDTGDTFIYKTRFMNDSDLPELLKADVAVGRITSAQAWNQVADVLLQLASSCPFWAQGYLSCRLVEHHPSNPPMDRFDWMTEEDAAIAADAWAAMARLQPQKTQLEAEVKENPRDQGRQRALDAIKKEHNLYQMKYYDLYDKHSDGNVMWHAYPTDILSEQVKIKPSFDCGDTWAKEQLLRSIVTVEVINSAGKKLRPFNAEDYNVRNDDDTLRYKYSAPRDFDRDTLEVGETSENAAFGLNTAKVYQQWYMQIFLNNDPGSRAHMFVTLYNMESYATSNTPWYVHAQGRGGIILKVQNLTDAATKTPAFPIANFKIETQFQVSEEMVAANIPGLEVGRDRRMIVTVPPSNVWPLDYTQSLRYGDIVTVSIPAVAKASGPKWQQPNNMLKLYRWYCKEGVLPNGQRPQPGQPWPECGESDATAFMVYGFKWQGPVERLKELQKPAALRQAAVRMLANKGNAAPSDEQIAEQSTVITKQINTDGSTLLARWNPQYAEKDVSGITYRDREYGYWPQGTPEGTIMTEKMPIDPALNRPIFPPMIEQAYVVQRTPADPLDKYDVALKVGSSADMIKVYTRLQDEPYEEKLSKEGNQLFKNLTGYEAGSLEETRTNLRADKAKDEEAEADYTTKQLEDGAAAPMEEEGQGGMPQS